MRGNVRETTGSSAKMEHRTPVTRRSRRLSMGSALHQSTPSRPAEEEPDLSVAIPTKPRGTQQLPPVNTSLVVQKKRQRVQLAAEDDEPVDKTKLIPSKSRTLSTSSTSSTRIPSLTETFRPELSPPTSNQSYRSFDESPAIVRSVSTPMKILSSPSKPAQTPQTSTPNMDIKALRRRETELDMRIRKEKARVETLKRARGILTSVDPNANALLIVKWREAAQRASNFLLNATVDKVGKTGGKREFVRREKEKLRDTLEYTIDSSFQDRIGEVTQSEEFEQLPEQEKSRVLQHFEEEQEKAMKEMEKSIRLDEDEDADDEFTMRDLYKRLKMDYKLVFPGDA